MKKILCTLLVVLMVFMSAPIGLELGIVASAEEEIKTSGKCGDNAYWTFDPDTGKLVISGTGDLYDGGLGFDSYYGSPYYDVPLKSVVIEDGITSIGASNFNYCTRLNTVTIPDSVTKIGNSAFDWCVFLNSINIPKHIKSIGENAFSDCISIGGFELPETLESIGKGAFARCISATYITVDENNKYYSSDSAGALFDKARTTLIQYPAGNTEAEYTLPSSVKTLEEQSFMYAMFLKKVVLPEGLTTIKDYVFYCCYSLGSVNLPEGLKSIGSGAFLMCLGFTEITLPKSLETVGDMAIVDCLFLDKVYVKSMDATLGEYPFGVAAIYIEGISQEEFIELFLKSFSTGDESYEDYMKEIDEDDELIRATIYCHEGSTAEAYAKANGANYVLTHFYEGEWTYDYDNSVRYRKCINCDECETEAIVDKPDDNTEEKTDFFSMLIAFLKSIFEIIKGWFK